MSQLDNDIDDYLRGEADKESGELDYEQDEDEGLLEPEEWA